MPEVLPSLALVVEVGQSLSRAMVAVVCQTSRPAVAVVVADVQLDPMEVQLEYHSLESVAVSVPMAVLVVWPAVAVVVALAALHAASHKSHRPIRVPRSRTCSMRSSIGREEIREP